MLTALSILSIASLLLVDLLIAALDGCDKSEIPKCDRIGKIEQKSAIQKNDTKNF